MVVKNIPCCLVLADKRIILIPSFSLFDFLCVIWVRCHIPPVLVIGPHSIPARIFCRCSRESPLCQQHFSLCIHFSKHPSHLAFPAWGRKDLTSMGVRLGRTRVWLCHLPGLFTTFLSRTPKCVLYSQLKIGQEEEDSKAGSLMLRGPLNFFTSIAC